jgi:hypothetical protein
MSRVLDTNNYILRDDGHTVAGYGENPDNVLVRGVSCFDPEPIPIRRHDVVDSRTQLDESCSVLMKVPATVKLAQDYEITLRFRETKIKKQQNVKHYSIFPVEDMAVGEFDRVIHGGGDDCCLWLPCELKAGADEILLDDGCEDSDLENICDFGVRALYQFGKFVFPRLNLHDRVVINGLLTLLSRSSQNFDSILENNAAMLLSVYNILSPQVDLPPTLTNYAGIVLGKIEDVLFPDDGSEGDVAELSRLVGAFGKSFFFLCQVCPFSQLANLHFLLLSEWIS